MENITDSVIDLVITAFFILLGFMNVVSYVKWCNTNVFNDLTEDKLKGAVTNNEPTLDDIVLTAEDVVYMVKMKNNDYYMTCPSLSVFLYAGMDNSSTFKKHSEYKQYFIEPQPNIEWNAYVDSWIANNIKGKLYAGDTYRISQRLWNDNAEPFMFGTGLSSHILYPIECANTNDPMDSTPWKRYNPLYGFIPTHYIDKYLLADYNANPTPDHPHTKDFGYFYWTLEPYYK